LRQFYCAHLRFAALTMVLSFAFLGSLQAADENPCQAWAGVWHIAPSVPGEGQAIHLSISTAEKPLRVLHFGYDFTTVHEGEAVKCDATNLSFDSLPMGKAFHISLKRDGDKVTGEMSVVHPQFKKSYGRIGHRVTTQQDWDPIKGVSKSADDLGLINLTMKLINEAPLDSLDKFESYWATKIEPEYYSVVQDVVYGPDGGLKERHKRLGAMLDELTRKDFQDRVRKMAELQREVVEEVKKKAPDLYFPNVFLTMPSLGDFQTSVLSIPGAVLVRLGSDAITLRGADLKAWLAQQHLTIPLYKAFPPIDQSLVARTIREGLSARFAVDKGLSEYPLQALGKPKPDEGADGITVPIELKKLFVAGIRNPTFARKITDEQAVQVGYDFARQMTTAYSVPEILALDRGNLSERFWSYLTAAQ